MYNGAIIKKNCFRGYCQISTRYLTFYRFNPSFRKWRFDYVYRFSLTIIIYLWCVLMESKFWLHFFCISSVEVFCISLQSCPAINVYTADNLDKALDSATRNFCKQEVSMFTEVDEIWMSKIFLWYRDDFGGNDVDVIE